MTQLFVATRASPLDLGLNLLLYDTLNPKPLLMTMTAAAALGGQRSPPLAALLGP